MSNEIIPANGQAGAVERALIAGDLKDLSPPERIAYYRRVCESTGLNPYTKPFDYITLNGKLTLYAKRDATDQLRKLHGVSVTIVSRERLDDVYVVTARATLPDGRTDESIGAVTTGTLKGDSLANALMKCETKAKRRVTLSICGLGWLDESETETIPEARPIAVNPETGEIADSESAPPDRLITGATTKRVFAAARALEWGEQALNQYTQRQYRNTARRITEDEAHRLLVELEDMRQKRAQVQAEIDSPSGEVF